MKDLHKTPLHNIVWIRYALFGWELLSLMTAIKLNHISFVGITSLPAWTCGLGVSQAINTGWQLFRILLQVVCDEQRVLVDTKSAKWKATWSNDQQFNPYLILVVLHQLSERQRNIEDIDNQEWWRHCCNCACQHLAGWISQSTCYSVLCGVKFGEIHSNQCICVVNFTNN